MIVVCPTWTPATSVIALSGPVGRMPTFRPKSEERGRALEVVLWAETAELARRIAAAARSSLAIAPNYINHLQLRKEVSVTSGVSFNRRFTTPLKSSLCSCVSITFQRHRKRESQHHVNGCKMWSSAANSNFVAQLYFPGGRY